MTIVSEIQKLQTNLSNAYDSLEQKGATLPEAKNFDNLPSTIESITGGGGGSTVFLKNDSDKAYLKNDKVLVNAGSIAGENPFEIRNYSYSYDTSTVFPWFFDNITFFYSNGNASRGYLCNVKDTGTEVVQATYDYKYAGLICYKNGLIVSTDVNNGGANTYILTKTSRIEIPKISGWSTTYLGSYKGKHYVNNAYQGKMFYYDPTTNTIDTSKVLFTGWSQVNSGYVSPETGSMIYAQWYSSKTSIAFFHIAEDGTVILDNVIDNFSSAKAVGYTGADIGDRIFFTTNPMDRLYASTSLTQIYRIVDAGNGKKGLVEDTSIPMIASQDCRVIFDNRNDVLSIGTNDGVYAYRFDRTTKEFVQLELDMQLGYEHRNSYALLLSPDLTKAVVHFLGVQGQAATSENLFKIYNLITADWRIVNNNPTNYNATVSFTGFATGNVDEDGKVEVQLLDIPTVNATVSTVDSEDYYSNIKLLDGGNNE